MMTLLFYKNTLGSVFPQGQSSIKKKMLAHFECQFYLAQRSVTTEYGITVNAAVNLFVEEAGINPRLVVLFCCSQGQSDTSPGTTECVYRRNTSTYLTGGKKYDELHDNLRASTAFCELASR